MKSYLGLLMLLFLFSCKEYQLINFKHVRGDIGREYSETFYDSSKIVGDFAINKKPITNDDYLFFLYKNMDQAIQNWENWLNSDLSMLRLYKNKFKITNLDKKDFPVLGVTNAGKAAYCKWLNKNKASFFKKKYNDKYDSFRIPSQIELQYAQRKAKSKYFWIVTTYLGSNDELEF